MPSRDFELFYESCFSTSLIHQQEGVDEDALLRLQGAERDQAAALILAALPTADDRRPLYAAGLLRLQAASAILRRRLESVDANYSWCRVDNAWALYQIERAPEAASILLDVLQNADHSSLAWLSAVTSLRDFEPSTEIIQGLLRIVAHADNTILQTKLLQHQFGVQGTLLWEGSPPLQWAQRADQIVQSWPKADRSALEELLLSRLQETNDINLVVSLGLIRSRRAAGVLLQRLEQAREEQRVPLAVALYRITGFPQAEKIFLDTLRSDGQAWERQTIRREALDALMMMEPTPQITSALLDVIEQETDDAISGAAVLVLEHLSAGNAHIEDILNQARAEWDRWKAVRWQPPPSEVTRQLRQAIRAARPEGEI